MITVFCSLPNASTCINGVTFTPCDGGVRSEPLEPDIGRQFQGIPGYTLEEIKHVKKPRKEDET